jgi:polyhydroxyalkanoate synthesis regulator phasin
MSDQQKQLDLFPRSEPEIQGQLAAFAVVLGTLLDLLVQKGALTKDEAQSLCRHSDLQTSFEIWETLQGETPPAELKRMRDQAERFLPALRQNLEN